jgi:hypothetical protein
MPESPEQISNEIRDLLQQAVLRDYPNPDRKGCMGTEVVREVAQRQLPIQDAAWEHIKRCSPCYREFLDFRAELAAARKKLVRRNRIVLALTVSAVVGFWIWTRSTHGAQKPPVLAQRPPASVVNPVVANVNIQLLSAVRDGDNAAGQNSKPVAALSRQVVQLGLSLPVGSDEGTYEVRILDGQLRPMMSGSASTTFTDHVASLSVTFDFSSLTPGEYVLGVKGPESDWRSYPIAVR